MLAVMKCKGERTEPDIGAVMSEGSGMEPVIIALLVAGVALLLSLVCMVVFVKSQAEIADIESAPQGTRRLAKESLNAEVRAAALQPESPVPPPAVERAGEKPEPESDSASLHRFHVVSGDDIKQCLFVILDWPGPDTNRRLTKLFEQYHAQYDSKLGVYTIRAPRAGYRLTVANSSPPGILPPIHEGGEQPIVVGVSILIHFLNKRNVARYPETLIELTQAIVAIGGHILDAERNVVSTEDFEKLREQALLREAALRGS